MQITKSEYSKFVEQEQSVPVFNLPWYLDIVCGSANWDSVGLRDKKGIKAVLVYYYSKSDMLGMPALVQTMGPLIRGMSSAGFDMSKYNTLVGDLIVMLPDVKVYNQKIHWRFYSWLPFFWNGYEQTTMYTYVIPDLSDIMKLWESLSGKHIRTPIRKAEKLGLKVVDNLSVDEFMSVVKKTFTRQGAKMPYSTDVIKNLWKSGSKLSASKMLFAVDGESRIHAVAFLVWRKNCCYYILGGSDPELRASGGQNFVIWEAIKFASKVALSFDFEGSMIPAIERSYSRYGGELKSYHYLHKDSRCWIKQLVTQFRKILSK